jgi:Zn-dependent peptidase ImmA (M78 family)/transcriptional regulator with XRE-family HTH domain
MIGERVKHARDFCSLTQAALADLAGVPQSKISEIEVGRDAQPKRDVVACIARATGFPETFFYLGPLPDLPDGYFRKLKRGKIKVSRRVRAYARQLVELAQAAEKDMPLPPLRLSPTSDAETLADIEAVADGFRVAAGLGESDPIPNMTRAAERAGIVVAGLPGEIPDHYGFSAWPDFRIEGRPVIVYSQSDPGDRQRFTIAHELGHLLLHSPMRTDELTPDEAEREANKFAGALLVPHAAAMEALYPPLTLTTLAHTKATFGTSIAACAQRARDLGLIDERRFVSLRRQLTSRGWHRQEPVEVPQELPVLTKRMLAVVSQGGSIRERAARANMPMFGFRALAGAS